jgi:hypothetical protein
VSGKGSKPRPYSVDPKTFSSNWDNIFNKKSHDACGTEDCCMSCDTAELGKDWYLTAINPWYKIYHNPKTNENKKIPLEKG